MTNIDGTRYVIERSWVRSPSGVCYFPRHECRLIYRHNIYMHIYIALLWRFDTWPPSMESQMAKNLISSIKLKRVINPNPLWWSRHIWFPWKLYAMELSHWHMNTKQNALAPPNDLASIAWMNKIAILYARIYEKAMCPNILASPTTILKKLLLLYVILNAYWYYCNTVNRYAIHCFVLEYQQSRYQKTL